MHRRIDLGLVACAFGHHDPIRVAERSEFTQRHVVYRRCLRCSRTLPPEHARRSARLFPRT